MSEEKNVAEALDEIFKDDPNKEARENEIAKLEKKREKALKKAEKKKAKKGDEPIEEASEEIEEEVLEEDVPEEEVPLEELSKKELKKAKKKAKKAKKEEPEEINVVKELISLGIYILVVIGICWLVLTFVGQRTEVSGESMNDTLQDGNSLWIDKLSYRFKDPERFDIIVFPYDDDDTYYIKRIIGLPGETVFIDEDGLVYINDEQLTSDIYGKELIEYSRRGVAAEPVTLGEDEYFVMGDNRNNSRDSRISDVGNITKDRLIGKAVFRFSGGFGKIE